MKPPSLARTVIAATALSAAACVSKPETGAASDTATAPLVPDDPSNCRSGSIDVYFNQWEYELNSFSRDVIARGQQLLAGCRIDHVRIVGLADATGDEQANLEVSEKRVKSIAAALEAGGWPSSGFELVALGERGAVVNGVEAPMRRRANISVQASPP
jgi:outer membrane protein OmpA-like peptidoglycan-associated protein